MNVLAINGSPHGENGNTAVMIRAILDGLCKNGDTVDCVNLATMRIEQCLGCHSCWFRTPGKCVNDDDMGAIIDKMRGSDILVFGTPVHFCNVSGLFKTFFDRMTAAGGNPHSARESAAGQKPLGYIMIANSGLASRSQFDVISLWIQRVAQMSKANMIAEIYAAGGKVLSAPTSEQAASRARYLEYLGKCGESISKNGSLDGSLAGLLDKGILEF
jgi:multimeric flavodoxin WrbA